jgi:predicted Fe-Mo cluster-binding NifX family protein
VAGDGARDRAGAAGDGKINHFERKYNMKIVVSSQGSDMQSAVDPRFGRARWFIVVDTDSGEFEAMDNAEVMNAAHGAGPQAAQKIVSIGAKAVITGHCGPNAFRALKAGGIQVITGAEGTVQEAVDRFKNGEFKEIESPDVQGHWKGMN